jgi:ADP-heptose:LPS heptosyltransferase
MNKVSSDGTIEWKRPVNQTLNPTCRVTPTTKHGQRLCRIHNLVNGIHAPDICIRRGEGIGDILMSTPIAKFLHQQFPGCKITYATNTNYLKGALIETLQNNPFVQNIIPWTNIVPEEFDAILDLHCPCVAHEQVKNGVPPNPISRMDLFARHIGVTLSDRKPIFVPTEQELVEAKTWLATKLRLGDKKLICIAPFASNIQRSIEPDIMKDVARTLRSTLRNVKILLFTHDSDYTKDVYWDGCADEEIKNAGVRKIASLIYYSSLIICPDSAMLHLAAALDKKVLAIFGHTDARARTDQYPTATAYWPGKRACQLCPCWYSEIGKCRHQICWKSIKAADILTLAYKIIEEKIEPKIMVGAERI